MEGRTGDGMNCSLYGQWPSEFDYVPPELLSEGDLMRVTVQFDIDADTFPDADDVDGAAARLLHCAANRIIKDGLPEPDGLGYELRIASAVLTAEYDARGSLRTSNSEESDTPDERTVNAYKRHLVNVLRECAESGLADSNPPWYVDAMAAIGIECDDNDLTRLNGLTL